MKASLKGILLYILCAFFGFLTGCVFFYFIAGQDTKLNKNTKDNTPVQEQGNGVFLYEENQTASDTTEIEKIVTPTATVYPELTPTVVAEPELVLEQMSEITLPPVPEPTVAEKVPLTLSEVLREKEMTIPSVSAAEQKAEVVQETEEYQKAGEETAQAITYPAEIFGQVPNVNSSDAYVTYFEFALSLVETVQPLVKEKGLSETSLFAQFMVKALVCGVDIRALNINEPISRAEAALVLWMAADILSEPGSDTSSKSAGKYVNDIKSCSSAEKKAVAYLYEQGILTGYGVAGQKFYPDGNLETETGNHWLLRIKKQWK